MMHAADCFSRKYRATTYRTTGYLT